MQTTKGSEGGMDVWDAIIIGGGPAGSIAGITLARLGRRAIILEKSEFPRFHIGESFLPATFDRLKELGLEEAFRKLPHVPKFGAEFSMGNGGKLLEIVFADGYGEGERRLTSSGRFLTRCC
jgi:2-polyprenyl-6-methoxyphenol hydroxylase-like FAD-dependent oxidoreductase